MGVLKRHIQDEADGRLSYYLPLPPDPNAPPDYQPPPRPEVPPGTVDAPLIRLFNFLRELLDAQAWAYFSCFDSRNDVSFVPA